MGDRYLEFISVANRHYDIADHMIYSTYPLVNDTKLILTIMENLYNALIYGVDALIHHNYLYKRISRLPFDFKEKIEVFKQICKRCGFDREFLVLLKDLNGFVVHRGKSSMEFSRGGSYVLADRDYRLKVVSIDKAKKYNLEVKKFMDKLNNYFAR